MARKNLVKMRATKITSVKLTKYFKPEMIKQLTPPFKAAAKLMEKEAKRLVPVDTGRLRDSIQAVVQFVRAQPFIRPAMIKAVKAMQIGRL